MDISVKSSAPYLQGMGPSRAWKQNRKSQAEALPTPIADGALEDIFQKSESCTITSLQQVKQILTSPAFQDASKCVGWPSGNQTHFAAVTHIDGKPFEVTRLLDGKLFVSNHTGETQFDENRNSFSVSADGDVRLAKMMPNPNRTDKGSPWGLCQSISGNISPDGRVSNVEESIHAVEYRGASMARPRVGIAHPGGNTILTPAADAQAVSEENIAGLICDPAIGSRPYSSFAPTTMPGHKYSFNEVRLRSFKS